MEQEFDFFELTGLPFDPCELNPRRIKQAIERAKADLQSGLMKTTQAIARENIHLQIRYLDWVNNEIFASDGRLNAYYQQTANQKTAAVLEGLKATATILSNTFHMILPSTLRQFRVKTKLSYEHVKEIFSDVGFIIVDTNHHTSGPSFPTNSERIHTELAALQKTKDPNPNGPDNSKVADLYFFAAYLKNDLNNVQMYRTMTTPELLTIFDDASRKFSLRNDDLGKLCGSLSTVGKIYIFNTEENRKAYDLYVKYISDQSLQELLTTLRLVPVHVLFNPVFAQNCIKKIMRVFPECETALAVYNIAISYTGALYSLNPLII